MKEKIHTLLLEKLKEEYEDSMRNYEEYRRTAIEAPGAMESHSDTTKFQSSMSAGEILVHAEQIKKIMEGLDKEKFELISVEEGNKILKFLIVPNGAGGKFIQYEETLIQTISATSLLGRELTGKTADEIVNFKSPAGVRKLKIKDIIRM